MDKSKMYEKCDIVRRTATVSNGEESFAETVVLAQLPCYVRPSKANTSPSTSEQANKQTVYITIDAGNSVRIGDIAVVGSNRYKVEESKAHSLIASGNVRLKCTLV